FPQGRGRANQLCAESARKSDWPNSPPGRAGYVGQESQLAAESKLLIEKNSCSGGLGVQGHNLLGDLLHVGNAAESDFHRSDHVIASALESIGHEHDVAGA